MTRKASTKIAKPNNKKKNSKKYLLCVFVHALAHVGRGRRWNSSIHNARYFRVAAEDHVTLALLTCDSSHIHTLPPNADS